jgi:hypothetical protein
LHHTSQAASGGGSPSFHHSRLGIEDIWELSQTDLTGLF